MKVKTQGVTMIDDTSEDEIRKLIDERDEFVKLVNEYSTEAAEFRVKIFKLKQIIETIPCYRYEKYDEPCQGSPHGRCPSCEAKRKIKEIE